MPQMITHPLDTFASIFQIQAAGLNVSGNDYPQGIPGYLDIVQDPLGQRGMVMRTTAHDTDADTSAGQRSEIRTSSQVVGEYWYRWKFMLPADWVSDRLFTIMQIHETQDGGDANRYPNFELMAGIGEIYAYVPAATLPTEDITGVRVGSFDLQREHWYDVCLHVNWQTNGTGFRELFVDSMPVFKQFGVATHYVDVTGPYLKLGVYDYYHGTGWGQRTAYYSDAIVWSAGDSMAAVMGLPKPKLLLSF